jgi:hypothetical protein
MVDRAMTAEQAASLDIDSAFVGHQIRFLMNLRRERELEVFAGHFGHVHRANATVALNQ